MQSSAFDRGSPRIFKYYLRFMAASVSTIYETAIYPANSNNMNRQYFESNQQIIKIHTPAVLGGLMDDA